jgi:hypothetical protein
MKKRLAQLSQLLPVFLLVVFPTSSNFQLRSYEFGGGGESMSSTNFRAEGTVGEVTGEQSSTNFSVNSGLQYVQMVNTPPAPTFVNSDNWYNKLLLTISIGNNPSDTVYAIAISDDDFVTTQYVQNDNTIGGTLGLEDYQTYSQWGGASGEEVIGLEQDTTYKVKVKAMQGIYTEGPYGPEATAATDPVTLSFDIDVHATDQETSPPYAISMGDLNLGSVTTATDKIWVDLSSNAIGGAYVFVYDVNAGLRSSNVNHTITSTTSNLSSESEGYGLRVDSSTNIVAQSPYDGSGENVGILDSTVRELFNSADAPVSGGRASVLVKAKTSSTTPSANDYTDTITLIASGSF